MPVFTRIFIRPQRQQIWIISTAFYPLKVLLKANWSIFTWAKRFLKPAGFLKQRLFSKSFWSLKIANPGTGTWQKSVWQPPFICKTSRQRPMPCGRRSKKPRRNCQSRWQRPTAGSGLWKKNRWPRAKPRLTCCGSRVIRHRFKSSIIL